MIDLKIEERRIELQHYEPHATVEDLIAALEAIRRRPGLRTATCHLCGECCGDLVPVLGIDIDPLCRRLDCNRETLFAHVLTLPEPPDLEERHGAIESLRRDFDLARETATLLYEYNNAEPLTFQRHASGVCTLQHKLLCTIYGSHPTACRFYLCNMGDRLSALYENIVRQGVWHSYVEAGWVPATDVSHNPFLHAHTLSTLTLEAFDVDLSAAMESLFFYF